jgi:ribosome biogenesis GTPase A
MKPLNESSRSKNISKMFEDQFNRLLVNKCDMHKKTNLKESIESSTLCLIENPSMSLSRGNPNLKDARLIIYINCL